MNYPQNNQHSLTITGLAVVLVMTLGRTFDVDFDEGKVTELVTALALVIGFVATYIGRYRQGDITWYGKKIKK